jgi:hypothetical protein
MDFTPNVLDHKNLYDEPDEWQTPTTVKSSRPAKSKKVWRPAPAPRSRTERYEKRQAEKENGQ